MAIAIVKKTPQRTATQKGQRKCTLFSSNWNKFEDLLEKARHLLDLKSTFYHHCRKIIASAIIFIIIFLILMY